MSGVLAPPGWPFFRATFNLVISAAGAGLLSYPYAMRSAGVVLTILLTLVFAVFNFYGLNIIARFTGMYYTQLKAHTYEELVGVVLGAKYYKICVAFLLWNVIGTLIGFLIIIGDLGSEPLQHAFECSGHFLCSRGFFILVICVFVVMPLSMLKDFHSLWFSSFLGVAGVVAVSGAIIARGSEQSIDRSRLQLFDGDISIVYSINIIIFALGCQLQVPPQISDLIHLHTRTALKAVARANQSDAVIPTVEDSKHNLESVIFCSILYNLTGLYGYKTFYENVNGDVLTNYADDDKLINTVKIIMAIHVALAVPINLWPGRKALDFLLYGTREEMDRPPHESETPLTPTTEAARQRAAAGIAGGASVTAVTVRSTEDVSAARRATGEFASTPARSAGSRSQLPSATGTYEPLLATAAGGSTPRMGGGLLDDSVATGQNDAVNSSTVRTGGDGGAAGSGTDDASLLAPREIKRSSIFVGNWRSFGQSFGFTLVAGLIATYFPKVAVVFSLIGASSSCVLTYTFPGYMDATHGYPARKPEHASEPRPLWQRLSTAFTYFGIVLGVFSTIIIVQQSFF